MNPVPPPLSPSAFPSLSPKLSHQSPSQPHQSSFFSPSHPQKKPVRSWADLVDESNKRGNKKQRLNDIMKWKKPQSKSPSNKPVLNTNFKHHQREKKREEGDKFNATKETEKAKNIAAAPVSAFQAPLDDQLHLRSTSIHSTPSTSNPLDSDTLSCDTQSVQSSDTQSLVSGDSMSCDTVSDALSVDSTPACQPSGDVTIGGGEDAKKKRKKNKKRKRKFSAADEGKKVFVGGITFEDSDGLVSNDNETLAALRHRKFCRIFYLFGHVNRIQGHWDSGYCFVVYSHRKDAKLAIKCLSMARVRRKVVQNLRDNIGPNGILPVPSFYVRWANTPQVNTTASPSLSAPSLSGPPSAPESLDNNDDDVDMGEVDDMAWVHGIKEEELKEEDLEKLMLELQLKVQNEVL